MYNFKTQKHTHTKKERNKENKKLLIGFPPFAANNNIYLVFGVVFMHNQTHKLTTIIKTTNSISLLGRAHLILN